MSSINKHVTFRLIERKSKGRSMLISVFVPDPPSPQRRQEKNIKEHREGWACRKPFSKMVGINHTL